MQSGSGGGKVVVENDKGARIAVGTDTLAALAREGFVVRRGQALMLSADGKSKARREAAGKMLSRTSTANSKPSSSIRLPASRRR